MRRSTRKRTRRSRISTTTRSTTPRKELREHVKGKPPENFLTKVAPFTHGSIRRLGVGKGIFTEGRWMKPERAPGLIHRVPYEMIRSDELPTRRSMKRGVSDLESYNPENPAHGSFPEYFEKVQSRVINGLVTKAIEEKLNAESLKTEPSAAVTRRAADGSNGNTAKPTPAVHTSDEYPNYERDKLDRQMHAAIRSQITPEYAEGMKFVYDMLRSGKHYGWVSATRISVATARKRRTRTGSIVMPRSSPKSGISLPRVRETLNSRGARRSRRKASLPGRPRPEPRLSPITSCTIRTSRSTGRS